MNHKSSITYLILIIAPLVFGCHRSVKADKYNKAPASSLYLHSGNENYIAIDTKQSMVTWTGSSLMGSNSHTGYVSISQGELLMENGQLVGGTVEIDMNTIEDQNHKSDNKLVNHLKDPDFFEVEKFPFATMVITKAATTDADSMNVTGDLTIKGITHAVTFPANVEVKGGIVKANAKLIIDRSRCNVRYKSAKFFELVANQTLSDSIKFEMKIVAKK